MFDSTSRYHRIETATHHPPDGGDPVRYLRRRFLPRGEAQPLLVELTVIDGERLDLIAHRTLGDPTAFWRLCDANNAMNPADLLAEPGESLRVAVPQIE
jgi:hypothetical protein